MNNLGEVYVAKKIAGALKRKLRRSSSSATINLVEATSEQRWRYSEIESTHHVAIDRPANFTSADWAAFTVRDVSHLPPAFVLDIHEAFVVGNDGWISPDLTTIIDDVWSEEGFPTSTMISSLPKQASSHLTGTSAVLALPWMPNFYHWTLQAIPRVALIDRVLPRSDIDNWIIPAKPPKYVTEWLDRLEIDRTHVVEAGPGAISCDRLIVPSIPCRNRYIPVWVTDFVRSHVQLTDTGKRRIFVARKQSEQRKIVNINETRHVLARHGFEDVEMNGKTIDQQASSFWSADIIVGVLGAGLTNLAFARPGTQVVELMPSNLTFPCYRKLSKTVGLSHHAIVGTEPRVPSAFYRPDPSADLRVDVAALDHRLESVLT